ncbi:sperm motility kinase Z-like protein [Cricetulus griseus]|uniref:Sperm motility kinase Z-like protein n=1 Tax=Cricetulus griseus TaxID=10029 RepID=A0A061IIE4_CRIGR|nr:sperm motility kinase Z-like protein [Cricetulus griseus]
MLRDYDPHDNKGQGHQHPQLHQDHGPRHGPQHQPRPGHHGGPGSSTGHQDRYGPGIALGHQHWSQMVVQTPEIHKVVTEATGINTDPGCGRTTDPDMISTWPQMVVQATQKFINCMMTTHFFPGSPGPTETPKKKGGSPEITEETAQCWDCCIRLDGEKTFDGIRRNQQSFLWEMRSLSPRRKQCFLLEERAPQGLEELDGEENPEAGGFYVLALAYAPFYFLYDVRWVDFILTGS